MSAANLSPSDKLYAADLVAELVRQGALVRGVTTDSRQVNPGTVFAAYPGLTQDGRNHIAAAIAAGASGVLWETEDFAWDDAVKLPNVAVHRLKQRISAIAAKIYGEPSNDLWTIGVTGTNGKTSCTHWLAQALTRAGRKAAVMGTLGNGVPPGLVPSGNTTGDAARIQATLAEYRAQGVKAVAMEVSSEGLDQGRERSQVRHWRADQSLARPSGLSRRHGALCGGEGASVFLAGIEICRAESGR